MFQTLLSIVLVGFASGCTSSVEEETGWLQASTVEAGQLQDYGWSAAFTHPTEIPDGDPGGVLIGPLQVSREGQVLDGVVLRLDITHAYVGDLRIRLLYDADRDGEFEASTPIEIYLARMGDRNAQELWAYPLELRGTYFFKDEGWSAADEEASLHVFNGLPGGGDFYLSVTDSETGNKGTVLGWSVSVETASYL